MTVFDGYADFYDVLYADKDYVSEAEFVLRQLGAVEPERKSILELGSGTGRHALEFLVRNKEVTGIDASAAMVRMAQDRITGNANGRPSAFFHVGDIRKLELERQFDFVVSLFHVFSYQTEDDDLRAAFRVASQHLVAGGKFLFDFWYGPAVLADQPTVRVKRLRGRDYTVVRIAEPVLNENANCVDVHYELIFEPIGGGRTRHVHETHRMRYLFYPEIRAFLCEAGLKPVAAGKWLSSEPLGVGSWYGWVLAEHQAVASAGVEG